MPYYDHHDLKQPVALKSPIRICALIAARNERSYLQVLLPLLAEQGIEVAIIDHGSSDGSHDLYDSHRGDPVITVEHLSYDGVFSLSAQMQAKQELASRLAHDWFVHHDADELLHHREGFAGLRRCIEQAEALGANGINFEEFVFLPETNQHSQSCNHVQDILRYYYLKVPNTLNRAFHRELIGCNVQSGGHKLAGTQVKLDPTNHVLRHYIGLSQTHLQRKYGTRVFCPEEVARGWHRKRRAIPPERLLLPISSPYLFRLDTTWLGTFQRSWPATKHYWLWSEAERGVSSST